jgi:uncharacterized damage-inducible protein DinB
MSIAQGLTPEFEQEMATTRRLLERLPDEKFGWKPHEKSWTVGELASHIVEMLSWGSTTIKETAFDMQPPGAEPYKPWIADSNAALLAKFDAGVAENKGLIAGASDADYMTDWSLQSGGQTLFTMPRVAVLRAFVFNHIVHHRGQLSVYLRLLDIPVPSIYGPSADEQPPM